MSEYWRKKYRLGHQQYYPWDCVVSFVMRYASKVHPRNTVRLAEVGCGSGSNVWFAAREGFSVYGFDISLDAIKMLQRRFHDENLKGTFAVANFTQIPFENNFCDLVIDRAALACGSKEDIYVGVGEAHRILKVGGFFFMNGYSNLHSSAKANNSQTGKTIHYPESGSLVGIDRISFLSEADIQSLFSREWRIHSKVLVEKTDLSRTTHTCHAEWHIVAEKISEKIKP